MQIGIVKHGQFGHSFCVILNTGS